MKRTLWIAVCVVMACIGLMGPVLPRAYADHGGQDGGSQTRVRIALAGAKIAGITPQGHADYRVDGAQRQLNVEVEKVNLANGTVLSVNVNGVSVGTLTLLAGTRELELNTKNRATVPVIKHGDAVTVSMGANVLLMGAF
ncbi:MAG: hypothetical protein JWN14_3718 [Chthonomonadales bacterium]|nr:hypothetical protein [Chthonomonadales bacterium]